MRVKKKHWLVLSNIINTLDMKIDLKITEKEKHFLCRLLAVVLSLLLIPIFIGFNTWLCDEFGAPIWTSIITSVLWWLYVIPIWRHCR